MTDKELLTLSGKAREKAYAPYSDFKVGAALLCADGAVFTGCNIENGSYGATVCAERTAIFKAVSEGYDGFSAIAVTSSGGGLTYPCGICLQVLSEFAPDITVILREDGKEPVSHSLNELLPYSFKL